MALIVNFADGRETYRFLPCGGDPTNEDFATVPQATLLHKGKYATLYRGYAELSQIPLDELVLKMVAQKGSVDAVEALKREYKLYCTRLKPLQDVGVVPRCYGLFEFMTAEGLVLCLALDYIGEPFELPLHELDMDSRLHLAGQIAKLHDAGIAHGDLQHRHLLLNGDNEFTIVDFQHVQPHICTRLRDVHEGACCPPEEVYGCPELWRVYKELRIWRPEALQFLGTSIPEDAVHSLDGLLSFAREKGLYDRYRETQIWQAAGNLISMVRLYRRCGGLRPREYCFYVGE